MSKIVGTRYLSSADYLREMIKARYGSVDRFCKKFKDVYYNQDAHLSVSLVNSWLCGRRLFRSSSAIVCFLVATLLSESSETVMQTLHRCMFGDYILVYDDDPNMMRSNTKAQQK